MFCFCPILAMIKFNLYISNQSAATDSVDEKEGAVQIAE